MAVDLTSHALTTLDEVKTELGIAVATYDDVLKRMINAASDAIRRYCERTFYYEEDIAESVPGFGGTRLIVSRAPIVGDIDSITYEGAALSTDSYSIESASAGIIYGQYGFSWTARASGAAISYGIPGTEKSSYVVTYNGGYITPQQVIDDGTLTRSLPYDLEDACIQLVTMRYRRQGRDPTIGSEKLLSWNVSYMNENELINKDGIPAHVAGILDKYRRLVGV